jgi:hypothetical protein
MEKQTTYSTFVQRMEHLKRILVRDRMKFEFQGYTSAYIDDFIRQIDLLKLLPDDEHYKRKLQNKSSKKEVFKFMLVAQFRRLCADVNQNLYKSFNDDAIHMPDKQLLHECCLVADSLSKIPDNEQLKQCKASFEKLISEFEEIVYEHEQATMLRIEKSIERNKITKDLLLHINELCNHGKLIWNSINYNNFEDYKIIQDIAYQKASGFN